MGIYIPGMEMPPNCCQCPVNMEVCKRGYKYLLEHPELYDKRADDCPIVPVPPHGRLIDADALYEKFARLESEAMNALKTTNTGSVNWIKWSAILTERTGYKYDIADAPTIIQASGGEENE